MLPTSRSMHVFNGNLVEILPEWSQRLAAVGLDGDSDWTKLSSDHSVSGSYNTTNNFCFELDDGNTIYFKRYVYKKLRFKYWLQPSKAAVEVAGFSELNKLGIPTMQTLAYGERRCFGLLQASFIVTKGIPGVMELGQFLARKWYKMPSQEKTRALKQLQPLLIKQLQTAHGAGFFHWDLKLRNILLKNYPQQAELIWIDCPRSKTKTAHNFEGIVADFYAMARVGCHVLTRGQQMRFLLSYCNNNQPQARKLYRAIAVELNKRPPRPFWHLLARDDPEFIRNFRPEEHAPQK